MKKIFLLLLTLLGVISLAGCGDKTAPTTSSDPATTPTTPAVSGDLVIAVGSESVAFYETAMTNYKAAYKAKNGTDFPANIVINGVDIGTYADTYLADTERGPDLFMVAHDNLGKLLDGAGSIEKISSQTLIDQMENYSPDSFLDVCYLRSGDGSSAAYYAVPLIAQSLVLYYDKTVFAGQEDKLNSWEGIAEVSKAANKMATAYLGSDGYNYSHWLLAQPADEATSSVFGKGTLSLYKNGQKDTNYSWGDDQVAIAKYAQRFTKENLGGAVTTSDGWNKDLLAGKVATVIGGAWSLADIINNLGDDGYGVTVLPTFTLTAADAYGTATAGMTFRSGSFADAKVMCKKKGSKFASLLDDILVYLSSDEIQAGSFNECANLPASKNVDLGDNPLAKAQQSQAALASIAQPFGFNASYNTAYYSKGAPDIYVGISQGSAGYTTDEGIIKGLQTMAYIWTKNKTPKDDATLAEWVATVK